MTSGADDDRSRLRGHRGSRLGGSPFWTTLPAVAAALAYLVAAVVWVVAGSWLPGGRWLAVHLFTLGVLTNVVLVFSDHFGRTLTKHDTPRQRWGTPVANVGILAVLVGIPTSTPVLVAAGAVTVTTVVVMSHGRLRTMVAAAGERRFAWIPQVYLGAHVAFVVGAALGMSMGLGWVSGQWYGGVRLAHLHVNVLGWAGLTVAATLTFFGPAMMRTRIGDGADERARRVLAAAVPALFAGAALLALTGVEAAVATTVLRLSAAVALAVVAWAVTVACRPVVVAARAANPGPVRRPVMAVGTWFPVAVWLDVLAVATGRWGLVDVAGLAMFLGVLAQLITAVITYLVPMLRSRGFAGRDWLLGRLERGEAVRTAAFNVGVAVIAVAAVAGGEVGWLGARVGWALLIAASGWLLVAALAPLPVIEDPDAWQPRSAAARRYRTRHPTDP